MSSGFRVRSSLTIQRLSLSLFRFMGLCPNKRRPNPMGVRMPKYTTPMKIGVVTLEIPIASPIHARRTGTSAAGSSAPRSISAVPIAPKIRGDDARPRHQSSAPSPRKTAPTASPNLRASATFSRAGIPSATLRAPLSIPVDRPWRAGSARVPGSRCGFA